MEHNDNVKELSPEWFEVQKETFFAGKDATTEERNIYYRGQLFLKLLERVTAAPPIPDEVEILKHYTPDPNCRTCHGKGRIGINRILEKDKKSSFNQLQLCYCVKPVESEYVKIEKQNKYLTDYVQLQSQFIVDLKNVVEAQNKIQKENVVLLDEVLHRIDRHTAGYWISKIIKLFTMKEEHAVSSAEEVHQSAQQD